MCAVFVTLKRARASGQNTGICRALLELLFLFINYSIEKNPKTTDVMMAENHATFIVRAPNVEKL